MFRLNLGWFLKFIFSSLLFGLSISIVYAEDMRWESSPMIEDIAKRLFGDMSANSMKYPYIVYLQNSRYNCRGAIISYDSILTAAHCIENESVSIYKLSDDANVADVISNSAGSIQIMHPLYVLNDCIKEFSDICDTVDVALIKLPRQLRINYQSGKAPLAINKGFSSQPEWSFVVGWPRDLTTKKLNPMELVQLANSSVKIIQDHAWEATFGAVSFYDQKAELPTFQTGDSGSPLIFFNLGKNNRHEVYAILSNHEDENKLSNFSLVNKKEMRKWIMTNANLIDPEIRLNYSPISGSSIDLDTSATYWQQTTNFFPNAGSIEVFLTNDLGERYDLLVDVSKNGSGHLIRGFFNEAVSEFIKASNIVYANFEWKLAGYTMVEKEIIKQPLVAKFKKIGNLIAVVPPENSSLVTCNAHNPCSATIYNDATQSITLPVNANYSGVNIQTNAAVEAMLLNSAEIKIDVALNYPMNSMAKLSKRSTQPDKQMKVMIYGGILKGSVCNPSYINTCLNQLSTIASDPSALGVINLFLNNGQSVRYDLTKNAALNSIPEKLFTATNVNYQNKNIISVLNYPYDPSIFLMFFADKYGVAVKQPINGAMGIVNDLVIDNIWPNMPDYAKHTLSVIYTRKYYYPDEYEYLFIRNNNQIYGYQANNNGYLAKNNLKHMVMASGYFKISVQEALNLANVFKYSPQSDYIYLVFNAKVGEEIKYSVFSYTQKKILAGYPKNINSLLTDIKTKEL